MSQHRAADVSQADADSRWKPFKNKGPTRLARNYGVANGTFRSRRDRGGVKRTLVERSSKNGSVLADESSESDQDCGGEDLIDCINAHDCSDKWMKTSEGPAWGLDGDVSPVMHSVVLLSDSGESEAACSGAELIIGSESEDDPLDLCMSGYLGPSVSPELSITPVAHMVLPSKSQEPPLSPPSGGPEPRLKFMIGHNKEESSLIGSGDEDVRDGNASDDSHCSLASGPSKPWQPVPPGPRGPCASCLGLYKRMKKQPNRMKSRVKDPASLYYDQWRLLKPWRPRGMRGYCRKRGKLFEHLPSIWQRAKVRAEKDLEDGCEVCTRPHVFLQRNLQQCQRSQPGVLNNSNKGGSRQSRKSAGLWPPVFWQNKRKKRSKNDSIAKMKKSVREKERGRPQETSATEKQDEDSSYDITADCSAEEIVNLSPDGPEGMNTDAQMNECPDEHVNAPNPSDRRARATVGNESHRYTGRNGPEDGLGGLGTGRHKRVDRHREKHSSKRDFVLTADGHGQGQGEKTVVGPDRCAVSGRDSPPSTRVRHDHVNKNVSTNEQTHSPSKPPHKSTEVTHHCEGKKPCVSTQGRAGSNVDDQGRCLSSVKRQTKSPPEMAALGKYSDMGPVIHLSNHSSVSGDKVLDGRLDRCVKVSLDKRVDVGSRDQGQSHEELSFEDVVEERPPIMPTASVSPATPAAEPSQKGGHTAVPRSKNPHAFCTPTPPGSQTSELVRKLRPFARTYEYTEARSGFKSMLCALGRKRSAVVRETDP